jgi:hypothetical protein
MTTRQDNERGGGQAVAPLPACESCGAPRGVPHGEGCEAEVREHLGEAFVTIEVED